MCVAGGRRGGCGVEYDDNGGVVYVDGIHGNGGDIFTSNDDDGGGGLGNGDWWW